GCGPQIVHTKTITVTPTASATELTCDICTEPSPQRCQGEGTTQFNSSTSPGAVVEWTITDDNEEVSNSISSTGLVTWDPQFSGAAIITLTANGCGGLIVRTDTIVVSGTPRVKASQDVNICP